MVARNDHEHSATDRNLASPHSAHISCSEDMNSSGKSRPKGKFKFTEGLADHK